MPAERHIVVERRPERTAGQIVSRGIAGGLAGALVMVLFSMVVAAARGEGLWAPLRYSAASVLGAPAMTSGGALLLGAAIQMVTGAILGVIFAALVRTQFSRAYEVAAALVYSALVSLVMTYIVLPVTNPFMYARTDHGWYFAAHLVFGAALGLVSSLWAEGPARARLERPRRA